MIDKFFVELGGEGIELRQIGEGKMTHAEEQRMQITSELTRTLGPFPNLFEKDIGRPGILTADQRLEQ